MEYSRNSNVCESLCVSSGKTIQLEKLKNRIVREVENSDAEDKCLAEYRREMELLLQEKMSHVEELRQIHADINAVNILEKNKKKNRRIIAAAC